MIPVPPAPSPPPVQPTAPSCPPIPVQPTCELPSPLTELYSDEYEGIDDSILTKAKELFQSISISDKQAKLIEKATRTQRACTE